METKIPNKIRKECGIHLLDCMVALGILGILMGMSIPHFSQFLAHRKMMNEAESIKTALEQVVLSAFEQNLEVTLLVSNHSCSWVNPADKKAHLLSVSRFNLETRSRESALHCYGSGVCSPDSIRLTSQSLECALTLSLRGRIRLICNE